MSDDPVAVIYSASLNGGVNHFSPGPRWKQFSENEGAVKGPRILIVRALSYFDASRPVLKPSLAAFFVARSSACF
jgi:hypothetical protein